MTERKTAPGYKLERYRQGGVGMRTTLRERYSTGGFEKRLVFPVLYEVAWISLVVTVFVGKFGGVFSAAGNTVTERTRQCGYPSSQKPGVASRMPRSRVAKGRLEPEG